MDAIPGGNTVEVDLRQLRAFEVLLRERNLTRAATVLGVAQPALSKTLAKLRRYFADPLFVRAGHRMEPTAKALELADAVHALLDDATMLRARHRPFDPKTSTRTFSFSVVDSGLVRLLPPLLSHLEAHAPGVRLRVTPIEFEELEAALEAGHLDFAMGSFRSRSKRIRRPDAVVRRLRQRRSPRPSAARRKAVAQRHSPPSATCSCRRRGTGHAHQLVERALERAIPDEQHRVPRADVHGRGVTPRAAPTSSRHCPPAPRQSSAMRFDLRAFATPTRLPRIDVASTGTSGSIASPATAGSAACSSSCSRPPDARRRAAHCD